MSAKKPFDIDFFMDDSSQNPKEHKVIIQYNQNDFKIPDRDPDARITYPGNWITSYWFKELKYYYHGGANENVNHMFICPITKLLITVEGGYRAYDPGVKLDYAPHQAQDAYKRWLTSIQFEREFLRK